MCKKKGITNRKSKDRFFMGFTSFLDRQMKYHFIWGPKEKNQKLVNPIKNLSLDFLIGISIILMVFKI